MVTIVTGPSIVGNGRSEDQAWRDDRVAPPSGRQMNWTAPIVEPSSPIRAIAATGSRGGGHNPGHGCTLRCRLAAETPAGGRADARRDTAAAGVAALASGASMRRCGWAASRMRPEALHITPSAISHRIRNLEKAMGDTLFSRAHRAVEVTPTGRRLGDRDRPRVRRADARHDAARRQRGQSPAAAQHLLDLRARPG